MTLARSLSGTAMKVVGLGLFAFFIFGPLMNLVLWSVAERWYTPVQAAGDLWHALLGGGVPPHRRCHDLARNECLDRAC